MNAHVESSIEMKRKYANACIGGALNSCIFRTKTELERHAKRHFRRLQAQRERFQKAKAKKLLEGDATTENPAVKAKGPTKQAKPDVPVAADVHVERMRSIAQSISDIPRTVDISQRVALFLGKIRDLRARDFYAVDDHSSAAAFEVANEILPLAERLRSQLHISLSYPDLAAVQATKIESMVRSL